ncbi:hypothetical protein B1810_16245 [Panacagrimonas perspica]|nr:PAS domain-containing protein [Panacagrimonas perspica]THD02043.1 hypothetical protein B1810_16245 [Panacagrimonas perspica]
MTSASSSSEEARMRALVSVTSTVVWVLSAEGRVEEEQPGLQGFTGLSFEEVRGDGWTRALHPDDYARVLDEWAGFLRLQAPAEIHYRMRRHDGEYRHMRARAVPMFDEHCRLREWVGANEDMTAYEQGTDELRDREARLMQFADSLPHIAWELDPSGAAVWVNRRLQEYSGCETSSVLGWKWADLFHEDDRESYISGLRRAVEQGQAFRLEARVRRADGEYRWFQLANAPQSTKHGGIYRWFGTATDIDDSYQATEKIHRFLATLAHELRNPLAPISNGIQILRMPQSGEQAKESALATIERQTAHMVRLLDDLMDLNRVRSDRVVLRRAPTPLSTVINTALETSRPAIEKGQHPLRVNLPARALSLHADATRLTQVLSNVLNNAAKFSPDQTPIDVIVTEQPGFACVEVIDRGIGMLPEMLQRAFDMFAQADTSVERSYGGLGIGLNVARRLVEMHGGTIEAASDGPGRGSRITIRLPLSTSEAGDEPVSTEGEADLSSRRRVMVVDDNEDAARIVSMLVESLGHVVRAASTGADALNLAEHFRPEVAILDIGMPGMSGYELARRCRQTVWGRHARLVALTGWGQEADRQKSFEAGFDHHLVKPAGSAALRKILLEPVGEGGRTPRTP